MHKIAQSVPMRFRIRKIREERGISQIALANAADISQPFLSLLERGVDGRAPSIEKLEAIAEALNVRPSDLFDGTHRVPMFGYVGAGDEIYPPEDGEPIDYEDVEGVPIVGPVGCVEVRGDSMYPAYRDGQKIFFSDRNVGVDDLVGRECVLRLGNGQALLKVLRRGRTEGRFTLDGYNAPPLEDAEVVWARPVAWVKK